MAITSNVARSSAEVEGARTLAELHGGRLWLESREGGGCTFTFTVLLPSSEQTLSHPLTVAEEGI